MNVRMNLARTFAGLCLMLAAPVVVQAQDVPAGRPDVVSAKAGPAAAPETQIYILGEGDVVEVAVLSRNDFTTRAKVRPDGTIQLPLLGDVKAAGHTAQELGDQVRKSLVSGGYFANPIVSVDIVSYASKYVTVLGVVEKPGLVPVDRPYRLSEIIARVGGISGSGADYVILRHQNGPEQRFFVRDLATGDANQDPFVSPGDKIYSPAAEMFFIYGEVRAPGEYAISTDMTLRKALARSGGVTASGSQSGIQVFRHGVKQGKIELDKGIEPGDVIVVKQRIF